MYNPPVGGSEWIKITNSGSETVNLYKVDSTTQSAQTYRLEVRFTAHSRDSSNVLLEVFFPIRYLFGCWGVAVFDA